MAVWPVLLASAHGVRLDQRSYQRDFGDHLWAADGADCWKLERMQEYSEAGFPSWEAFMAGDWSLALRLYEDERPAIAAFQEKLRRHGSRFCRVRDRAEPDGAVRCADHDVVSTYEAFARGPYEAGEDVESYFARAIAHLPPPPRQARPAR